MITQKNRKAIKAAPPIIMHMPSEFLRDPVSNGSSEEQALIRRWWHKEHEAQGRVVWEYHFKGNRYADAIWFPDADGSFEEEGKEVSKRFPLAENGIVLCEAKDELTPELVGQALVYRQFALYAGALVRETVVFAETGSDSMRRAALDLGLTVVIEPL